MEIAFISGMKRFLVHSLLLVTVAIWPTSMVISGPPRSWERVGEAIEIKDWELPKKEPVMVDGVSIAEDENPVEVKQRMAKVGALKARLNSDRNRLVVEQKNKPAQVANAHPETNKEPQSGKHNGEKSLRELKVDHSSDDVAKIEWVGKDRRLQRVKKSKGNDGLQLFKPPNKLIVTDRYHKTIPELLSTAELRRYGARPTESSWSTTGSKFLCEIRHPIPGFGYAVFKRGVGQQMQFAIESFAITGGSGPARVQSVPPIWKHYASIKDLGMVPVEPKGNTLFTVSTDWAGRLMLELQEGMEPTFAFWDGQTGGDDVVVKISPFKFKQTLPEFNRCMGDLLPYSFKDVQQTTVLFGYDKATLSSNLHARLKKIVEYVKLDETVKYVEIKGFSDSKGFRRYNELLAKKRANAVKKFLLAQGLDKNKIQLKALGEKGKKHSNRTESGRRKNRRVEVSLVK